MKTAGWFVAVCAMMFVSVASGQDGELVPNRLAVATIGEWASYRMPNGYIQKLTVTKRNGSGPEAEVTVRIENIYDGEVINAQDITHEAGEAETPPRIPEQEGVTVSVRTDSAIVKGKPQAAAVVQINRQLGDDEDSNVEWWVTPEIPVFGIIKKVEDGEIKWEIEDWGME